MQRTLLECMKVVLVLVSVLLASLARGEDAECKGTDFEWYAHYSLQHAHERGSSPSRRAYNEQNQSPCKVANALVSTCSNAPFAMLDGATSMWGGPSDDKSACMCSLVQYNLLRVRLVAFWS